MMKTKSFYYLLFFAILISCLSLIYAPFSKPLPAHLEDARQFLEGKSDSSKLASGYTLFLIIALKLDDLKAVFLLQAIVFVALVLLSYLTLYRLGVHEKICFLGALCICLHPILVINIKRISDNNLAIFLILLFINFLLSFKRESLKKYMYIIFGFICGFMVLVRINLLLMLLLFPLLLWLFHRSYWRKFIIPLAIWFTVLSITAGSLNYIVKKRWNPIYPYYGAYTFYCGTNPLAAESYLKNNAPEEAIDEALYMQGFTTPHYKVDRDTMSKVYLKLGWQFIREHPYKFIKLLGIKIYNFFRPDYRKIYKSTLAPPIVIFVMQTILAFPFFIWLGCRLYFRNVGFYDGLFAVPFAILYILPFILSNTDPRLRWPLDIILILDSVFCFWRVSSK